MAPALAVGSARTQGAVQGRSPMSASIFPDPLGFEGAGWRSQIPGHGSLA